MACPLCGAPLSLSKLDRYCDECSRQLQQCAYPIIFKDGDKLHGIILIPGLELAAYLTSSPMKKRSIENLHKIIESRSITFPDYVMDDFIELLLAKYLQFKQ